MRRSRLRLALTALVVGALVAGLAGCVPLPFGGRDDARLDLSGLPALDDVGASWSPATREEEIAARLDASANAGGDAATSDLVDAFDTVFGGMPGATPSDLPSGGSGFDPTWVLAQLRDRRADLTPDQRAAFDAVADATGPTVTIDASTPASGTPTDDSGSGTGTGSGSDSGSDDGAAIAPAAARVATTVAHPGVVAAGPQQIRRMTDAAIGVYADWRRYRPDFPADLRVAVTLIGTPDRAAHAGMDARCAGTDCQIRVYPSVWSTGMSAQEVRLYFAHEFFHLQQFQWASPAGQPDWVVEGAAEFAALDLLRAATPTVPLAKLYQAWFTSPGRPLATLSYNAWPLFELWRQDDGDPYAAAKALLVHGGGDTGALLKAAGMDGFVFALRAGSAGARPKEYTEPSWFMQWPSPNGTTGPTDAFTSFRRGVGTFRVTGLGNWSHVVARGVFDSAVGVVLTSPVGGNLQTRTTDGPATVAEGTLGLFCVEKGGCRCPDGETSGAAQLDGNTMLFGFEQKAAASEALVATKPWDPDEFCHEPTRKRAVSNGDPHLTTYDGAAFTSSAVGEFVLTRDPKTGFEVQTRNLRYRDAGATFADAAPGATGTTAVAMRLGKQRVTLTADSLEADARIRIRIDGKDAAGLPAKLAEGAVERTDAPVKGGRAWTVPVPGGGSIGIAWYFGFWVEPQVPAGQAARMTGLLGSANGDLGDDFLLPDGSALAPDADLDADYAAAWRVPTNRRLFDDAAPASDTAPAGVEAASDDATSACADRMPHATGPELAFCAFDLEGIRVPGVVEMWASAVADRLGREQVGALPAPLEGADGGGASIGTPTPTSIPRGTDARAGEPALTIAGRVGGATTASGVLHAEAGTILLLRASDCRDTAVQATISGGTQETTLGVCGPSGFGGLGSSADADDEVTPGTNSALLAATGDYRIELSGSDTTRVSVDVFADPTPDVRDVSADGLDVSTTLTGVGDTLLLRVRPGSAFTDVDLSGIGTACYQQDFAGADDGSPVRTFDSVCRHGADTVGVVEAPGDPVVIVVFSPDAGPHPVRVRATDG